MAAWLATLHFGPYWTRRAVREAQSDQSAGHIKPSFGGLQKTFVGLQSRKQWLQGQSCWKKTYVSPFISRWVINFEMKTQRSQIAGSFPQCEYIECVALICQGEWVSPLTFPFIRLHGGWGAQSVNSAKNQNPSEKTPKLKRPLAESDSDNDSYLILFPKFIVQESTRIPQSRSCLPSLSEIHLAVKKKPKSVKKWINNTLLVEVPKKLSLIYY